MTKPKSLSLLILERIRAMPRWAQIADDLFEPVTINAGAYFDIHAGSGRRGHAKPNRIRKTIAEQMLNQADWPASDRRLVTFLGAAESPFDYGLLRQKSTRVFAEMLGDKIWESRNAKRPEQDIVAMWTNAIKQTCFHRGHSDIATRIAFSMAKSECDDTQDRSWIPNLEYPSANTVPMNDAGAREHFGALYENLPRIKKPSPEQLDLCLGWVAEIVYRSMSDFLHDDLRYVVIGNFPEALPFAKTAFFQTFVADLEAEKAELKRISAADREALKAKEIDGAETRLSRVGEDYRDGLTPNSIPWNDMTPEKMGKLIWEHPATSLGVLCGVSDVAIHKYCKRNDIERPGRGYWLKDDRDKSRRLYSTSSGPSM